MITLVRKLVALFGSNSFKFGAKSALITTSLISASRVFAGNSPSVGPAHRQVELNSDQLTLIESLLIDRLKSADLTDKEQLQIDEALLKVERKIEILQTKDED